MNQVNLSVVPQTASINACISPSPNTPLFLKAKGSAREKLSLFTLIELLVLTAQYCRNHVKVLYDRIGMQAAAGGRLLLEPGGQCPPGGPFAVKLPIFQMDRLWLV